MGTDCPHDIIFFPIGYKILQLAFFFQHCCNRCVCNAVITFNLNDIPLEMFLWKMWVPHNSGVY